MSVPDAETILDPIRANAERHPDKLLYAFLDGEGRVAESFTYAAFLQRTTDIAAHIRRVHPLEPGACVLLIYPPGLEMICAFFACVRLGLVPVPAYPPSSQGFAAALYRMDFIARDCQAAAVLTERSYFWSMKLHRVRTGIAERSFNRDYTSRLKWIVTDDAEPNARGGFPEAHSDVLFLQYTSGSTREPRGVIVTHRNILQNCRMTIDHRPVGVSWLPQYHDMGLIGSYLFLALAGGTTYGLSPVDFIRRPLLWLQAMSRYRATISGAPSFAYAYCLRRDKVPDESLAQLDLSSLEILMNAAEPVRADVFRGFLDRFAPCGLEPSSFCAAYGLAEYTLAVANRGRTIRSFDSRGLSQGQVRLATGSTPPADATTLVSCGRPLATTEVRIVDTAGDSHRLAAAAGIGEVWLAGPSRCRGYWNRPELSQQVFDARYEGDHGESGWLRTGDLGFLLDGELYICGRTKDVIIIRGSNYFPQDIEAIVEEDLAIRPGCVAAFAVEHEHGEGLVIVAELKDARRLPDTRAIHRNIGRRLGITADSFVYIRPRTIPKTSSGKIMRHSARARWREGGLQVVAQVETALLPNGRLGQADRSDVEAGGPHAERSLAMLEETCRRYRLTGTESGTLVEAGLDSLNLVEFASDLQSYLESRGAADLAAAVDVRWLQKITIAELFDLLHQLAAATPLAKLRYRQALAELEREHRENEQSLMRRDARMAFDVTELPPADFRAESSDGGILLTGGTGFFGPFLLLSLLEQTRDDLYVVVRAEDVDHGRRRLREGLASLGLPLGSGPLEGWEQRVIPVCGDLARPRLGMSAAQWDFLADNIHTIYHNGALVNYLSDYAAMRAVNVGGTNEMVRLALSHRPKVVNHISSTFVFGWSTKATLYESDNNETMTLLDFGYSQSKWVSEQIVFDAMRQGLAARVFRPALITPSIRGGGYNYDIAIRLLAFMIKHGMSTTARNQVSFSPADVVADNIVAISRLPDSVGKTFHVTRDSYANMRDITAILGRILGIEFMHHSLDRFVPLVIERCGPEDLLFPLLNFLVRSADNITAMEFKRYCNRNYREARDRSACGRQDPPLEDVVLGIVRFMRRHGLVEAAGSVELSAATEKGLSHVP